VESVGCDEGDIVTGWLLGSTLGSILEGSIEGIKDGDFVLGAWVGS